MWHDSYRLFAVGSRTVAAVPAGRSRTETARLILALPAPTRRQRLMRAWLAACARGGRLSPTVAAADLPLAGSLAGQPLACMQPPAPGQTVLLAWPARTSRRRFYALRVGSDGRLASVTKVGVASPDRERIRNEARAIDLLSRRGDLPFRLPQRLQAAEGSGWSELEIAVAPRDWRPCPRAFADYPARCVASWAGPVRRLGAAEVADLDWWRTNRATRGQPGFAPFARAARAAAAAGLDAVCAHGDLGPGNMLARGEERLVFDWESYAVNAPLRADLVGYWLATHHRLALGRPAAAAAALRGHLVERSGCANDEITLALAFLIAQDSLAAERVAPAWATD